MRTHTVAKTAYAGQSRLARLGERNRVRLARTKADTDTDTDLMTIPA